MPDISIPVSSPPPATALAAEQLFTAADLSAVKFRTTDDIEELTEIAGQQRAMDALRFGVDIQREGYNLFVMGPLGIGRHSMVRQYLETVAQGTTAPSDWCYVNNFDAPHKPLPIELPAGRGARLRDDIVELVDDLQRAIPSAFDSDEYRMRIEELTDEIRARREQALVDLAAEATAQNIQLTRTPRGFSFMPLQDGKVLTPEEYAHLDEPVRKRIEAVVDQLQEKLETVFRQVHRWQKEAKERERELNQDMAKSAVDTLMDDVVADYRDIPAVLEYLECMRKDVLAHAEEFISLESQEGLLPGKDKDGVMINRYQINLLVDSSQQQGRPIIYEDSPTYDGVLGRIEHIAHMGTLVTDYSMIKPGALHLANGGYLILDILKVLQEPFLWNGLKRALTSHEIRIQSLANMLSMVSTVALEPGPIPLDLKVILVGERLLFYLLLEYDPEFTELFKVAADFENEFDRNHDNTALYCRIIATIARREKLKPFDREAVARLVEHGSRLAGDAEKLSSHLLSISDLMRESDYWALKSGSEAVSAANVQTAIEAQVRRADRIRERTYEEIRRGTILIDTRGEKTGQVNGLSVINLGNFMFAQPFRITATARLGHGNVVDIEREVELGGAIHSKGVLILSSFLAQRYASEQLLSLDASLVFEQSYGAVEGDSASVGELGALLSVLADLPVRQSVAVTGSVNQRGDVQPIGGVNEKIEGFFDVCRRGGLTGQQGVIIPQANIKHLMLRADVVAAAAAGQFHIHPVSTIDQAITLLTGVDAGVADEQGVYPPASVNGRVAARLARFAQLRAEMKEGGEAGEKA